jgi:hypothetical protein
LRQERGATEEKKKRGQKEERQISSHYNNSSFLLFYDGYFGGVNKKYFLGEVEGCDFLKRTHLP